MKGYFFDSSLILPKSVDNTYRGLALPKYFFFVITIITTIRSCIHILLPDGGAQSIATIPLDSYSGEAAAAVVYLFGVWGLSQLIVGLFYLRSTRSLRQQPGGARSQNDES